MFYICNSFNYFYGQDLTYNHVENWYYCFNTDNNTCKLMKLKDYLNDISQDNMCATPEPKNVYGYINYLKYRAICNSVPMVRWNINVQRHGIVKFEAGLLFRDINYNRNYPLIYYKAIEYPDCCNAVDMKYIGLDENDYNFYYYYDDYCILMTIPIELMQNILDDNSIICDILRTIRVNLMFRGNNKSLSVVSGVNIMKVRSKVQYLRE